MPYKVALRHLKVLKHYVVHKLKVVLRLCSHLNLRPLLVYGP